MWRDMIQTDILFFAGIKHSGKTTMARLCAKRLGIPCHDNDDLLFETIHDEYPDVRTFYRAVGPERFMKQEAAALRDFINKGIPRSMEPSAKPKMIIALGGGACDNDELMDIVKRHGMSCYLANDPQVLLKRILRHGVPPFLDPEDTEGSFAKLYERRDGLYRSICDFVIQLPDCENPEDTCDFLLESLDTALGDHGAE